MAGFCPKQALFGKYVGPQPSFFINFWRPMRMHMAAYAIQSVRLPVRLGRPEHCIMG